MDDAALAGFVEGFYGYGAYESPLWFVGIEEGGGRKYEDVERRVAAWAQRGKPELEDLQSYHNDIDESKWFRARPPLQPYWRRLMRIAMLARGHEPSNDEMREMQRTTLGSRSHRSLCILELMPIACQSTRYWPLAGRTEIRQLQNKKTYVDSVAPRRAQHLGRKVEQHHPDAVVFCSSDGFFRRYWNTIAQLAFERNEVLGVDLTTSSRTTFVIMKHPTAKGVFDSYFDAIGRYLGSRNPSA